jgi:integrase
LLCAELINAHLAPKTTENYNYGARKFKSWLKAENKSVSVNTFLQFTVDCYNANLDYSVPNFARSWLANLEKQRFDSQPVTGNLRLRMALDGYKKMTKGERAVRTPIQLRSLRTLLSSSAPIYVRLAFALAYAFLLRTGEIVKLFEGQGYVEKVPKGWILYLPVSKGDPFALGTSVFFRNALLPPDVSSFISTHLHILRSGITLVPSVLNQTIHALLGPRFVFHCLRHGRATDLFRDGTSLATLMTLGRWATKSAVTCYVH